MHLQVVKFAATALYDKRSERIEIMNTHVDANEFSHSVPRIGHRFLIKSIYKLNFTARHTQVIKFW